MSQNPLHLQARKELDLRTVNIDVIDQTVVNINETDIREFIPPCHDYIPKMLFYENYHNDNLWDETRGLETAGKVIGFALNKDFFANALEKHLSYPVHTAPWFFSPFISAYATTSAVHRGNRAYAPQSVIKIWAEDFYDRSQTEEKPYIYSLLRLYMEFQIPAVKYEKRPYSWNEYLIFKGVPRRYCKVIPNVEWETSMLVCLTRPCDILTCEQHAEFLQSSQRLR